MKSTLALLPTGVLVVASAIMFGRERRVWSVLQLAGALGMMLVVIAHFCEALQIFSWMGWGQEHSPGHYLDLSSAMVGITLFPLGCLLHALDFRRRRSL